MLRQSRRDDIRAMHRVRMAVTENPFLSTSLSESDYWRATESDGRGWVIESDGKIVAFTVGKATDGNIWALFVQPGYEGLGLGRELLDTMVTWLWAQGLELLWLNTSPNTRAAQFYEQAGWSKSPLPDLGELRYELRRHPP